MKVFCYDPQENWIIDRIVSDFKSITTHEIVDDIVSSDAIMFFAPWAWKRIVFDTHLMAAGFLPKFILFLHHIVPSKFDLQDFLERDKYVDLYICPNKITEAFIVSQTNKRVEKINYWINQSLWQQTNREETRKQLSLDNKFVIFSAVRDTEGAGCDGPSPQPKVEKNPEGLVQAVKLISRNVINIHVLLAGWRRQFVIKRLKEEKIDFTYIERPEIEAINRLYDAADLVVSPSLFEGGPQCVIEAGYKKVPIISTDAGLASEILNENCVFDVTKKFYLPTQEDLEYNHQSVLEKCNMQNQINKIDKFIESII